MAGQTFLTHQLRAMIYPTSRSMIFVSPDGERSMNTYLGISADLSPDDVPQAPCRGCRDFIP